MFTVTLTFNDNTNASYNVQTAADAISLAIDESLYGEDVYTAQATIQADGAIIAFCYMQGELYDTIETLEACKPQATSHKANVSLGTLRAMLDGMRHKEANAKAKPLALNDKGYVRWMREAGLKV